MDIEPHLGQHEFFPEGEMDIGADENDEEVMEK
jgi:hypothetical protein